MKTTRLVKRLGTAGALVIVALIISACTTEMAQKYGGTVSAMRQLSVGMSRDDVLSLLGRPDGVESANGVETLRYNDRLDGILTGPNNAADYYVSLINGLVTGYGRIEGSRASAPDEPAAGFAPSLPRASLTSMTCMKQGEALTGFTRQCSYDCLGNVVIQTVDHTSLCSLTITR